MTDVLLTHSYHLPYDRKQLRKMTPYPPLATLYAAGLLRASGFSVAVFDSMLEDPAKGFGNALQLHQPKIVAIYEDDFNFITKMCLTRMRELAWQMSETARRAGARVIVHGSDATDHAVEYLRHGCDYVLDGEAERPLLELVRALNNNGTYVSRLQGVRWLDGLGALQISDARRAKPQQDSTSLPLPARDLIDLSLYREAWKRAHGFFSMNLIASRGCPFRCNWCAKPIFGDTYQLRPARDVAEEMKVLRDRYGADHLWFADDIFALNRHWIQEFAAAVEELGCAVPFKIQARADLLTNETVHALKRAGCAEVWMGVESGSQKVLDAMEKGLRVEQVVAARQNLKRAGIVACYFLQLGYPGENWQDLQKTIALVRETRPDDIGVSFSYPLPNTRFHARVREQLGKKQNWSDSEDLCVMFKGAYTDQFYRAVRDALHAEVDSWNGASTTVTKLQELKKLWNLVDSLEPVSRNPDATQLPEESVEEKIAAFVPHSQLVQLRAPAVALGEINE
jgi:anaerobic magnesium-protoporphyrin IX monomethyl ester cyclase